MDLSLLKELLNITGSSGGLIALVLIIWFWGNHFKEIEMKLKGLGDRIDELKKVDEEQGKILVKFEQKFEYIEKEIEALRRKVFNNKG